MHKCVGSVICMEHKCVGSLICTEISLICEHLAMPYNRDMAHSHMCDKTHIHV